MSHVRYPEDLFKLQRDILTRYHVSNPVDFYNQNDRWQVPDDPTQDTEDAQPPYYILAQRPGDDEASFQLTSALNAFNRENLSSFISASSDPDDLRRDPGAAIAGQHPVPRAAAGAAVVHHEQPGQTGPDAVQQPGFPGGVRQPAHPAHRRQTACSTSSRCTSRAAARTRSRCCRRCWSTTATGSATPTPWRRRSTRSSAPGPVRPRSTAAVRPPDRRADDTDHADDPDDADHASGRRRRDDDQPGDGRTRSPTSSRRWRPWRPPSATATSTARARRWRTCRPPSTAYQAAQQAGGGGDARPGEPRGRARRPRALPPPAAGSVGSTDAGWSSSVARWAHNPEVAGSNPAPATRWNGPHSHCEGRFRSCNDLTGRPARPPCRSFQRSSPWPDEARATPAVAAPPRGTSGASATGDVDLGARAHRP